MKIKLLNNSEDSGTFVGLVEHNGSCINGIEDHTRWPCQVISVLGAQRSLRFTENG